MKKLIQILFFFLLVTQVCFTQWVQTDGPYGGAISCFTVCGSNLFAGTYGAGVFLSTNNGASWKPINSGLTNRDIRSIDASGTNIYAGSAEGVFLSTDTGMNWTEVTKVPEWGSWPNVLCVSANGQNIFAGTWSGVYRSNNKGTTWTNVTSGLGSISVNKITIIGTDIFVGTYSTGVFLSTNNGSNWTSVNSGLPKNIWDEYLSVISLAGNGTNLYAGIDGSGVYRSTDKGTSWTQTSTGLIDTVVNCLAINGTNVFAGSRSGIFLSTNNGSTWAQVNSGLMDTVVNCLAVSGENIFAGTNGVYLSTDRGNSWVAVNFGLTGNLINTFAMLGTNIFVGTSCGISHSSDGGISWTEFGPKHYYVTCSAVMGSHIIMGGSGLIISTNNGTDWNQTTGGRINSLAMVDTNLFFVATYCLKFCKSSFQLSTDYGLSSIFLESLLPSCFAVRGANLFAGASDGIYVTTDNGTSWKSLGYLATQVNSLAILGSHLFAGSEGSGIYKSMQGDRIWSAVNEGLPTDQLGNYPSVNGFFGDGTNLFVCTSQGVYLSTNSGANWFSVNAGLPSNQEGEYRSISCLYSDGTYLFAGTEYEGIWRRPLSEMITSVGSEELLPTQFLLEQNYPNPFNPSTKISWQTLARSWQTLKVYDVLGCEVKTLVNEEMEAGFHSIDFSAGGGSAYGGNAESLPSGVYFYQLRAGSFVETKKMILLR